MEKEKHRSELSCFMDLVRAYCQKFRFIMREGFGRKKKTQRLIND